MDIIGVLDFLKFKIQNWANTNIFSYEGSLFDNNIIIVIGSNNINEAIVIIIFVYLTRLAENDLILMNNIPNFESVNELERALIEDLKKNIKEGYPRNRQLEQELRHHLEVLLKK